MFNLVCIWGYIFVIYLAALNCSNDDNGRCEDLCINMEGFVTCRCGFINETLVPPDHRICACELATYLVPLTFISFTINVYNVLYS